MSNRKQPEPFEAFYANQHERRNVLSELIFTAKKRVVYVDGRPSLFDYLRHDRFSEFVDLLKSVRFECYYTEPSDDVMIMYKKIGNPALVEGHVKELNMAKDIIKIFNETARRKFDLDEDPIAIHPYDLPPLFPIVWIDPDKETAATCVMYGVRFLGADYQDSPSMLVMPGQKLYEPLLESLRKFRSRYNINQ